MQKGLDMGFEHIINKNVINFVKDNTSLIKNLPQQGQNNKNQQDQDQYDEMRRFKESKADGDSNEYTDANDNTDDYANTDTNTDNNTDDNNTNNDTANNDTANNATDYNNDYNNTTDYTNNDANGSEFVESGEFVDPQESTNERSENQKEEPYEVKIMNKRELTKAKNEYLAKMARLSKYEIFAYKTFTLADDYDDIKNEYERMIEIKNIESWQKKCKSLVIGFSGITEYLMYSMGNPYDIELKGWSKQMTIELDDEQYEEVFEQLYVKYHDVIEISPELKLCGMLLFSGYAFNMSNKHARSMYSKEPDLNEVLKRNPRMKDEFETELHQLQKERMAKEGQSVNSSSTNNSFLSTITNLFSQQSSVKPVATAQSSQSSQSTQPTQSSQPTQPNKIPRMSAGRTTINKKNNREGVGTVDTLSIAPTDCDDIMELLKENDKVHGLNQNHARRLSINDSEISSNFSRRVRS